MAPNVMRLARRLDEVGFSDIVQVRNKVMELRAAGQTVHAFHGGEPFFDTPTSVKYALLSAAVENKTRYAPSSGIEPLRQAIAAKLNERNGLRVSAENVIVTAGGAHALYVAFQAVLDPGDDVLLFSPYWTPDSGDDHRLPGASAAGAHGDRAQLSASPGHWKILPLRTPARSTTTLPRILPAPSSLARKRKKWQRSPGNTTCW